MFPFEGFGKTLTLSRTVVFSVTPPVTATQPVNMNNGASETVA